MKVRQIMTGDAVSCQVSTDMKTAARKMLEGGFGTLPVVDLQGRVVGIITDRDIALACATRQRNASHISVLEAMSRRVRTCFADDEIAAALHAMEEAKVRRLPVVDADGHLAGIISIDDIVLRAAGVADGITPESLVGALQRICARREEELVVDVADL